MEREVQHLRVLQHDGRHGEVLRAAQTFARERPDNRDLLLIAASSLRHLQRFPEALATLERLEAGHPRFSQLHQERGLCRVAQRDAAGAIDAFLRAVNINPALPASWSLLASLYRMAGDAPNAATALAHVRTLEQLPPEIVTATSMVSDGDLAPAEPIVRGYLLRHGDHPEAMRLLAKIGVARDVLDDAEALLQAVVILVPDHRAARLEYAQVLVQRHKYAPARGQLEALLAIDPTHGPYRELAATVAVGLGEHERAIDLYREMLADEPASPDLHLWLGHALKTIGRLPEAIGAYTAATTLRPDFGDAWWSLANLKLYRFDTAQIARMDAAEASPATMSLDRQHLCFALGKALEDDGETAESWAFYTRGAALKRAGSRYAPEVLETNTREQIRTCPRSFFERRRGWGVSRPDPIFIVGLPRSGSTLLEQILASHSQVEGTQELADIQAIVLELQGRDDAPGSSRYPAVLADLPREAFDALGERYLRETAVYRTGKPRFVDKMPNNFRHIGLIHATLPDARIIDARREPMACCFSNLKQLFAQGQEFTYSVEDIARYYRTYLELMRHWDDALPGRVLRVQHEDVVDDLAGGVRRILDHCGLEFEPACVDFHKTRRSVRTPSSEQVRQPIFRDGLEQWRRYEAWLLPLREALGDATTRYRE